MEIYDGLGCKNRTDGLGITIEGRFEVVGKSSLGPDIYEVNLINFGTAQEVAFNDPVHTSGSSEVSVYEWSAV